MAEVIDTVRLTPEQVRDVLRYDAASGRLFWRERSLDYFSLEWVCTAWNARHADRPAFSIHEKKGYCQGKIFGRTYLAHRIIWLMQTGEWPPEGIDHINGDRVDNRWVNLRRATPAENAKNVGRARNNTSGVTGVYWNKRAGKWRAEVRIGRTAKHLGLFDTLSAAAAARAAANVAHGFSPRHGT